jgi:hypothetical protein
MVIDQIDIRGIAPLEAEDDPPVDANGDAPITRELTFQRMAFIFGNSAQSYLT